MPGVESLADCQAACIREAACEAVLFSSPIATSTPSVRCYRKANIVLTSCAKDESLSLYVKLAPPRPPLLPAPRVPPLPPSRPPSTITDGINRRFHRKPYSQWPASGAPADAGVLLHIFDGWEEHDTGVFHSWRADLVQRPELSASIIYADQRAPEHPQIAIPVYENGYTPDGVILRPGESTRIVCGSASDTGGGACKGFCPSVTLETDQYDPWRDGRDGCGGSWRPQDFGVFLHRSVQWQREVQARGGRMDYNEVVVDGRHWNSERAGNESN